MRRAVVPAADQPRSSARFFSSHLLPIPTVKTVTPGAAHAGHFRRFSMSRAIVLSLILLGLSACADNILKERPTRSTSASGASVSKTSKPQASICGSYRRQLHQVQIAKLMKNLRSQREALLSKELSLNAVIADVCE